MKPVARGAACPAVPVSNETVTLSHGEGGRAMRRLIRDQIAAKLGRGNVQLHSDAACLGRITKEIAITTDSYVVSPLFFPGGDIGSLAVHGTVNDLAMAGATPCYLTLSLILEEGLPLATLGRVIDSVAEAASNCDVKIVAGDTKVVPKGAADGIFINTTGVGVHSTGQRMTASRIQPGDALLVSGPIARHGLAVLAARESLGFDPPPESDSAPLHRIAAELLETLGDDLRTMRDATRGGIAAVMHEWAEESANAMWIDESQLPLLPESRGVCELLGLDPLLVANEGTFVAAIAPHRVDDALSVMRSHSRCGQPAQIGHARARELSPVLVSRGLGADQPLDEPIAAMLPRIC
ncbi:hydrogenase expression/formation protein HypE [Aporhodopirellula aestuarii]|uniref:Hydrogenase expression/formation protein HypE n=1 Tax=Aporhodopirellula aestuarii TaxID=2950107 RepID=A0ABT0TYQ3_9BACT|nr:hydrogenase expression/formation protein HypE [Aporhodopirellula aestuarii]MCM2369695.1 hydrogenase expression/formation protein HypE [Aporhodopirellula aestuarii]